MPSETLIANLILNKYWNEKSYEYRYTRTVCKSKAMSASLLLNANTEIWTIISLILFCRCWCSLNDLIQTNYNGVRRGNKLSYWTVHKNAISTQTRSEKLQMRFFFSMFNWFHFSNASYLHSSQELSVSYLNLWASCFIPLNEQACSILICRAISFSSDKTDIICKCVTFHFWLNLLMSQCTVSIPPCRIYIEIMWYPYQSMKFIRLEEWIEFDFHSIWIFKQFHH